MLAGDGLLAVYTALVVDVELAVRRLRLPHKNGVSASATIAVPRIIPNAGSATRWWRQRGVR